MPPLSSLALRYVLWFVGLSILYGVLVSVGVLPTSLATGVILASVPAADVGLQATRRATRDLAVGDWGKIWGLCMAIYLALSVAGPSSAVLAGRFSKHSMGMSWLAYWYGHLRLAELARSGGRPLIYAPGTLKQAASELTAGHWVIGTPDVPPSETRLARPVTLFGRPGLFTEGLLRIARDGNVPLVIFTLGLDLATGRRDLRIEGPFDPQDPELLQRIAAFWEGLIREKSWGFTLWPMMPAYFHGDS